MDNLPELRDIHLPTEVVSFFPPAYGWWVLLSAVIVVYFIIKLWMWGRRVSAKFYAYRLLSPLKDDFSVQSAAAMSVILRRICVRKYPDAVAFSGQRWIDFLNEKSKEKLDDATASLLQNAPFLPAEDGRYQADDVSRLWQFCYKWIGANL